MIGLHCKQVQKQRNLCLCLEPLQEICTALQCKPGSHILSRFCCILHCPAVQTSYADTFGDSAIFSTALQCKPTKIDTHTLSEVPVILHFAAVQTRNLPTFGGSAIFSTAPQCKPTIFKGFAAFSTEQQCKPGKWCLKVAFLVVSTEGQC